MNQNADELENHEARIRRIEQRLAAFAIGTKVNAGALAGVVPPSGGGTGSPTGPMNVIPRFINNSGGALAEGDVVIRDLSANRRVTAGTTNADIRVVGVVSGTDGPYANGAETPVMAIGWHAAVAVQGAVAAGDYLAHSSTSKKAVSQGGRPTVGSFAVALAAAAGPGAGTVAAFVFPVDLAIGNRPGPPGPEGPPGDDGPPGPRGARGPAGATGAAGAAGRPGVGRAGDDGPEGDAGPPGRRGPTGATGATGATGPAGARGRMGPPGMDGDGDGGGGGGFVSVGGMFGPASSRIGVNQFDGVSHRYMRADAAPAVDANMTPSWQALHQWTATLGVTQDDTKGINLATIGIAAAGAQQISPAIRWTASGWKTNAVAAAVQIDWRAWVLPVQGAAAPTSSLKFQMRQGGVGAYTDVLSIPDTGLFANPSGLIGMTAVNGVAGTADRSDSTHAIDPAIAPSWTGVHTWTGTTAPQIIVAPATGNAILRLAGASGSVSEVSFRAGATSKWQLLRNTDDSFGLNDLATPTTNVLRMVAGAVPAVFTVGYFRAGAATAPSNVSAGDITGARGHFGTDGAFGTGESLSNIGWFRTGVNSAARPDSDNGQGGLAVSWNFSAGGAETDLWNLFDNGGGFAFKQKTGAATHLDLVSIGNITGNPIIAWDSGDYILYGRSTNEWDFYVASTLLLQLFGGTGAQLNLTQAAGSSAVWIQAINTTTGLGAHADAIYVMQSNNFTNANWAFFTGASHIDGVGDHWILFNRVTGNNFQVLPNGSAVLSAGPMTVGSIIYPGSATAHVLGAYIGSSLAIGGGVFIPLYF